MSPASDVTIVMFGIALTGATVTGALGYGFSSISVPLALLFLTNVQVAIFRAATPLARGAQSCP